MASQRLFSAAQQGLFEFMWNIDQIAAAIFQPQIFSVDRNMDDHSDRSYSHEILISLHACFIGHCIFTKKLYIAYQWFQH